MTTHWIALKFILLLGVVSFLGDMTYEGARSITGPFLATLGASAAIVGIVAGLGELVGYALRIISGYLSDRIKRYWLVMLIGYLINLIAVPLLAFAGNWQMAAVLIVLERAGKAIRHPPRDAMLSHAATKVGRGWGFGLHHIMDQMGGFLGPILVAAIFYFQGDYRTAFACLAVPAALAIVMLVFARYLYPRPRDLEEDPVEIEGKHFASLYWLYVIAASFLAVGYADFALIAYHFKMQNIVSDQWIPLYYSIAMGCNAIAGLVFGRLFDKIGILTMMGVAIVASLFAPLVFLGGPNLSMLGMALWGIGMGTQNSVMKAAIGAVVPSNKRASAYGIYNTVYGIMWFLGSAVMGIMYDISLPTLIIFSMLAQLASIPLFLKAHEGKQ